MTDLLIVGAGPVGLMLACDAARHGLRVRIIDQNTEPSIYSKAQIIQARTLEALEDLGLVERFLDTGIPIHAFSIYAQRSDRRLAHVTVAALDSHFEGVLSISQAQTEAILTEHLRSCGVEVERGVRLDGCKQDPQTVRATLTHIARGTRETCEVPWLAGCDGSHSSVRTAMRIPFEGETYPVGVIQADARVDFPFLTHEDEVIAFVGPDGVAGFFPLSTGEHRYRFLVPLLDDDDDGDEVTLERFQHVLDRLAPPGATVSDPAWMCRFHVHRRVVPQVRKGRVFLCGDAAHIHGPAGGQGMNTGMQDAYNLAWKLALVHRGEGTEALLTSYQEERHQVARETVAWTDRASRAGAFNFTLRQPLAVEARDRLAGFVTSLGLVRSRVSRLLSMLDIHYTESSICTQDLSSVLQANVTLDLKQEIPSVASWVLFAQGPRPGERARDVHVDPHDAGSPRLFDALRGTSHTLLLFDGAAETREGYANLIEIARAVQELYGALVRPRLVIPRATAPDALAEVSDCVLLDPHGVIHEAYGAQTECLYLIRPDDAVGYRCQPARRELLMAYLCKVLVESTPGRGLVAPSSQRP